MDLATVPEVNRVLFTKAIGQETNVEPDLLNLAGIPGLEVIYTYIHTYIKLSIDERGRGKS